MASTVAQNRSYLLLEQPHHYIYSVVVNTRYLAIHRHYRYIVPGTAPTLVNTFWLPHVCLEIHLDMEEIILFGLSTTKRKYFLAVGHPAIQSNIVNKAKHLPQHY